MVRFIKRKQNVFDCAWNEYSTKTVYVAGDLTASSKIFRSFIIEI